MQTIWKWLDRLALSGMGLGLALMLQPWWAGGFRVGFLATLFATILHVITSHVHKPEAL